MTLSLLAANYDETLTSNQSTTRIATIYAEAVATSQTTTRLATSYIEALTPADLDAPAVFIGWGVPI